MARPITIGDCSIMPRRGGGASKEAIEGGFVLKGTDIEVRSSSVSSEWTTESSDEADSSDEETKKRKQANKATKRKVRTWRIKCKVDERRDDRNLPSSSSESESSSGGSSGSTSTGSSTSGEGECAKQKRQRRQLMREWEARKSQGTLDMSVPAAGGFSAPPCDGSPQAQPPLAPPPELFQVPPPPGSPPVERLQDNGHGVVERSAPSVRRGPTEWFNSKKRHRCFCIAPGFLSVEDINQIHSAAHHPSVKEINDRKGYLAFKHRVWRFEAPLRALYPELYNRLIGGMMKADGDKWKRVRKNSKRGSVYPEIEYITYDVAEMGEPCFIEPHVDNKSAVTMVAMLSDKRDYVGGKSCFRRAHGRRGHRQYELEQGDLVMFRGEKLSHWITPVVAGRRVILQIELSRV